MKFKFEKCPVCGKFQTMMTTNNPICQPICFECISDQLDSKKLAHADMFCRTYNLPFKPDLWIKLEEQVGDKVFEEYTRLFFDDTTIDNLEYAGKTTDVYAKMDAEWEKCRTQEQIYSKLECCRDAYIMRARMRWGDGYSFEEYLALDNSYSETIKSNNVVNKLQKNAIKMLCKLDVEQNRALAAKDTTAMKDYATVYKTYAATANLEEMIQETKTDDITTVSELVHYIEKLDYQFPYYQGAVKDEVDQCLKDISDTIRRLVLESTGLTATLEKMMTDRQNKNEAQAFEEATSELSVEDLMEYEPEDNKPETEDDASILEDEFEDS